MNGNLGSSARRRRGILVLAVAVGLVGFGLYYFLSRPEAPSLTRCGAGQVALPVVRVPIRQGMMISNRNLDIGCRAPADVPADAIINPAAYKRRIALIDIAAGDYLRDGDLAESGAPPGFSGQIEVGERVVVLPVDAESTVDYLRRGDTVDVIAVFPPPGAAGSAALPSFATSNGSAPGRASTQQRRQAGQGGDAQSSQPTAASARLVAEAARVLTPPRRPRTRRDQPHAALAVDVESALRLQMAQSAGHQLRLVLRPFDEAPRSTPSLAAINGNPQTVEIIRGARRDWVSTRPVGVLVPPPLTGELPPEPPVRTRVLTPPE